MYLQHHSKRFLRLGTHLAFILLIFLAAPQHTPAQAVKGALLGTITDTAGAAAVNATVTITETRTNITTTTTTNSSGNYVFSNLQDGTYRVEASLSGFKRVVRDDVEVKVNTTIRVDLGLEVGNVSESVQVTAEAPLLQTDRADTGRLLESKQVSQLPLGFNRNFQGLLVTVPGATRPSRPHSEFFNPQDSLESKVNGQSRMSNNFQIEGVNNNQKTGLLTVLIPAADAIESVSISTSNFDAELGSAGGAVSSVTLKSGTNDIHGSVWLFGNNENTRAREYFSGIKAPTRYRQLGVAVGGPIIKNKLFYFGDYQYTSDKLGKVNRHIIPIMDWRNGDFRNAIDAQGRPVTIYDPATGNPDGTGRTQISCNGVFNVICPDRISPIARNILGFIPTPNITGAAVGKENFLVNTVRVRETHSFDAKVNYQLSEKDQFAVRFSFQRPELFDPGSYGIYGGPANDGFAGSGFQNAISSAVNYTRTFNPRLILEARVGVSWYNNKALTQAVGLKTSDEVGISGVNIDETADGLTRIQINGFSNPVAGFSPSLPWDRGETTSNFTGTVTHLLGNHTFKAGGEFRRNRDFLFQVQDQGGTRGRYIFSGAQTGLPGDSGSQNSPANAFASFLLDRPSSVGRDLTVIDEPGTRHWAIFSFFQDKWQVSQKLTLDLGLRHEYYNPHTGLVNQGGLSNYEINDNTLRIAGYGDVSQDVGVRSYLWNFAPRLGMAYRFSDRSVLRAGFGSSIIPFPDNRYALNFPVKQNNQFNPPNSFAAAGSMAAGLPAPLVFAVPDNGIIPANTKSLLEQGFFYVPPDLKEARIHSWNIAFQHELFWGFSAEAAYVGNIGRGILSDFDLNAGMTPGQDNNGRPFNQKFGKTASVRTWFPTNTSYHSLQIKIDRRFSKGLLVNASYTLGRARDFSDDNGGIATPADPSLSEGPAGFDRRHSFVTNFVWDIPFARNLNRLGRAVFGGWQLAGIFSRQSGMPIDIFASGASLRAPGNTQRPVLNGEPEIIGEIGQGSFYFDTSVFGAPPINAFSNLTRNASIRGPGYINLDGSLVKRFRFTERIGGELRIDALNVTNTPNFNNPNGEFLNPRFGQVTTAFGERLVRFGARVTF
jgi:carboxypeptidase family protein/TonB-dependent receptor-like protein